MYDVIIVGGGPAGLSAALVLARACRSVIVIDQGNPRNAAAKHMHGYLSRDGINPHDLLRLGRKELAGYGVKIRAGEAVDAKLRKNIFTVVLHTGAKLQSRKLLLATGVRDQLPRLKGLADFYGISIHHCPYCDCWEWRRRALAAYGDPKPAIGLALCLKGWSDHVVVLTDGAKVPRGKLLKVIEQHQLKVFDHKIDSLAGGGGKLKRVVFDDKSFVECDALFFNTGQRQKSSLAEKLGCEFDANGGVKVDKRERTGVPGLYLCGDASKDVQFVVQAAAEGAIAAVAINKELQKEEGRTL